MKTMAAILEPYRRNEVPEDYQMQMDQYLSTLPSTQSILLYVPHTPSSIGSWTYLSSGLNSPTLSIENGYTPQSYLASHGSLNTKQGFSGTEGQSLVAAGSPFSLISLDSAVARLGIPPAETLTPDSQHEPFYTAQELPNTTACPTNLADSYGDALWQVSCGLESSSQYHSSGFDTLASQSWTTIPKLPSAAEHATWPYQGQHSAYVTSGGAVLQSSAWDSVITESPSQLVFPGLANQLLANNQPGFDPCMTYGSNNVEHLAELTLPYSWPQVLCNDNITVENAHQCPETNLTGLMAPTTQDSWPFPNQADRGVYPRAHHSHRKDSHRISPALSHPILIAPKSADGKAPTARDKQRARLAVRAARDGVLQSSKLRRVGHIKSKKACWVCVLQKDPCEMGGHKECNRCAARLSRGHTNILGCVRTHLKEMQTTILPGSMTQMHERDGLIQYVEARATCWRGPMHGIEAYLTTGFGPSFKWTLHEYQPAWPDLLCRLQTTQQLVVDNGVPKIKQVMVETPSPPLGLRILNESDGKCLGKVLDDMIVKHLPEFQRTCFKEKNDFFRKEITSLLCSLYMSVSAGPTAGAVHNDLRGVLKMLAITLIMNHTIDLDPRHHESVLNQLSERRDLAEYPESLSPWMVSMQLKYFFSEIRKKLYADNLERLNNILHSAKSANPRLSALVLVLGFALALEECQYTTLLQAEGRIIREEMPARQSWSEAREHCANRDATFDFMQKLFHCRYTVGKNKQRADLNDWVQKSQSPNEKQFLANLFALFDRHRDFLKQRKDLPLDAPMNGNHSCRFLARFMLDVM